MFSVVSANEAQRMGEGSLRSSKFKKSNSRSSARVCDTQMSRIKEDLISLQTLPTTRGHFKLGSLVSNNYDNSGSSIANVGRWVKQASMFFQAEGKSPNKTDGRRHGDCTTDSFSQNDGCRSVKSDAALRVKESLSCPKQATEIQYDDVSFASEERVFLQPTAYELVRHSDTLQKHIMQLDLQAPLPQGKTNWEVIQEVHESLKAVLTFLESIVGELSDKFEFYKTSKHRKYHAKYCEEDNEDIDLYESLYQSFDDVSSAVVEHCLQAISLVANCIDESLEITDFAPRFLLQAAFDFVNTCSRIARAQESMIIKKKSAVYAIEWSLEQEDKRVNHVWKLIEAVSGYVIASQSRVLQLASVQLTEIRTYEEQILKFESHLQQTWTWSSRISKRVAVLCPSKKKDVFVYLLSTFIQATEELCHCQNLVWSSVKEKRERPVCSGVCSFHKRLLHCLAGMFSNADEVVAELKKSGLISDCEFPQVSEAFDNLSEMLTLLLSTMPEHIDISISHSCLLTEAAIKSGKHLIPLTKEYMEIVLSIVPKNTPKNEGIKDRLRKLCCVLNNVYSKLKSEIQLNVDSDSTEDHTESTNADHEEPDRGPLSSANDKEQTEPDRMLSRKQSDKRAKPSVFANPSSHPAIKALDNTPACEADAVPTPLTKDTLKKERFPSEVADSSLDRRLPSMPCPDSSGRIHIKKLTEVKHLGSGSSGAVTLMKYNNSSVAVKEPVCPDPNRARQRLERECTVHQRINCHANIVRFFGRVVKTDEFGTDQIAGIITEWCQFGDLRSAIKDAAWIQELDLDGQDTSFMSDHVGYQLYKDWTKRLEIIAEVAAGMVYMHSHNIVHRDLTCKHVLFDSIGGNGDFGVKICDFERAYYLPGGQPIQRTKAPANSPPWMGPEVLNHEKYGLKADMYSIGTLLWQLMYLQNPWTHLKQRVGAAGSTVIQHLLSTGRISLSISEADAPEDVPEFPDLVRLVKHARERDPDNRPTMAEFYKDIREICTRMKERVFQ